jgi:hypothetical protein
MKPVVSTRSILLPVLLTAALLAGCPGADAADRLREGFVRPPHAARPWVYWFWMDGNVSRAGITADLEAMRRAGLGGLVLMEVDVGVPRGPVRFMSEAWQDLFAHAVHEAERLGLEITLNAGPGWTGSGGPWVKPEQSMQHLVASSTEVSGPQHFEQPLPQPPPRDPHFVHNPVPASLRAIRDTFYRDVAVLAFPTPAEGGSIADSDEKALYYRNPYSSHPGVKPFLEAPARFAQTAAGSSIVRSRVLDLTSRLRPDGTLAWEVPEGRWTLMRFGRTSTGANTRPAPEPGIGLESDKFDPGALDAHFQHYVGALLKRVGKRSQSAQSGWTFLHIDSWEMGAQNWTAQFQAEFRKRRGYDPLPFLPAMTGRVVESLELSERYLWDVRQTANELVVENHAMHLKELGRRHGLRLSIEPYDMNPTSDLSLGGVADVPMCEFWSKGHGFDSSFSCLESVSIAHTLGKPIVAAEAFTAGDSEAWRLHPGAMKAQADWAFCAGINRLVFHRYAHQPWPERFPGMTMGPYGVHYERTQTWWPLVNDWHDYLARCQFLLQQGLPVADICYVAPEGAPHVFRPPRSALRGDQPLPDRRGYNFDGCAPETVQLMSVRNGRVTLPGGMSYRVLVLPEMETMTPKLLRQVKSLVERGATVIGPAPSKSPSLADYPGCDEEVARLAASLWPAGSAGDSSDTRRVGKGLVVRSPGADPVAATGAAGNSAVFRELYPGYGAVARLLRSLGVPEDFEADATLRFTHKRAGQADVYFVANGTGKPLKARCSFRVTGRQPELWNPMSGTIRTLPGFSIEATRTLVPLEFDVDESCFIVFREKAGRGSIATPNHPQTAPVAEIRGPWTVRFPEGRGAPRDLALESLIDGSTHADPGVRFFSGVATYSTRFDAARMSGRVWLDLGRVAVVARVRLNGSDVGTVWKTPFRLDISRALQPGSNTLEVEVANLWLNRLIGDSALPQAQRVTWTTWNPYKPGMPLPESGLLGPVRILQEGP